MNVRDVEIRHLAALVAVADTGSFGRAAGVLGFTQSAISQQIAALERALGEPVFDRPGGPRPVSLTPSGVVVLRHARDVLARLREAERDLADLRAGERGRLTLGTFQSVSVKVLPPAVGRLRAERPHLEIRLVEIDEKVELLRLLRAGELDATFAISDGGDEPDVRIIPLMCDPFVVVAPASHPSSPMTPADLHGVPLIGEYANSCQSRIEEELRTVGIDPNYVFRTNDNGAVQAMVRAGMGQAVMPLLAVDTSDAEVVVRTMDPPFKPRRICLAVDARRSQPPALERMIEIIVEVSADIEAALLCAVG